MNKAFIFLLTTFLLTSIASASTFGYNYLDNKIYGNKTIINNYNNYTINNTIFNNTQFNINGEDVSISTSWLMVVIEEIVDGYNYITGSQVSDYEEDPNWNAEKDNYAKYQYEDNSFNGTGNITTNQINMIKNTSIGICSNGTDTFFGYIDGAC
jgi:hypothetical protein